MKKEKLFSSILLLGFILGILFMNLFAIDYLSVTGIFNQYYLEEFLASDLIVADYFLRVVFVRIIPVFILLGVGNTRMNKICCILFLLWIGFLFGLYMSLGIIQLGVGGIVMCVIGVLPQIVFYIPAYIIVFIHSYKSIKISSGIEKVIVITLCMICGIFLECQVNPILMKWYINIIM